MLQLQSDIKVKPEVETPEPTGWGRFTPEVSWFVYNFFKRLKPYDKLMFYGYYVIGFNTLELAERFHCSFQYISTHLDKINKAMKHYWEKEKGWRLPDESKSGVRQHSKKDKRRSK